MTTRTEERPGTAPSNGSRSGSPGPVCQALAYALLVSVVTVAITWKGLPLIVADATEYLKMAEGRIDLVPKPFCTRILHPFVVRALALNGRVTVHQAFWWVGLVSLIIFTSSAALILRQTTPYAGVAVPLLLTPFLASLFRMYYLPDLFHAALLGVFFLLVLNNRLWESLGVLLLLHLTRESTLLLTAILVVACVQRSRPGYAFLLLAVAAAGTFATFYVSRMGQPNIHHMNSLAYMLLKVPFNFCKNVFGIILSVNTFYWWDTSRPLVTFESPTWMRIGSIHTVGVCGFVPARPLQTLQLLLTTFGIAPVVVVSELVRSAGPLLRRSPSGCSWPWSMDSLHFCWARPLVIWTERLVGYGWPAFLLAAPVIVAPYYEANRAAAKRLLFYHVLLCWMPLLAAPLISVQWGVSLLTLAGSGVVCRLVLLTLREMRGSHPAPQMNPPANL